MENVCVKPVRNVAVVSNVGAGKTSLSEALLYMSGTIPACGSVTQKTTVSDFEPEEHQHRSSVSTSLLHFIWKHTAINLLDPPGALSLLGEPLAALQAVDALIVVLNGNAGVRTELVRVWMRAKELELPALVFVNGFDREGVSFASALEICRKQLECPPIPMVLAVDPGPQFEGVVDLLQLQVIRSGAASMKIDQAPPPPSLVAEVKAARQQLVEAVAETDERLLESYAAQGDLNPDEVIQGLRA